MTTPTPSDICLETWQWPLNISQYDRQSELTSHEIQLIHSKYTGQLRESGWLKAAHQAMPRLIKPLLDALAALKMSNNARHEAVGFILTHMAQTGMSYWGISSEMWLEVFHRNYQHQWPTHKLDPQRQAIATLYMLEQFTAFHHLEHYAVTDLAVRVFGREYFEAALHLVTKSVRQQGYRYRNSKTNFRSVLAHTLLANHHPSPLRLPLSLPETLYEQIDSPHHREMLTILMSALPHLSTVPNALPATETPDTVSPEWARWCERWYDTSTLTEQARDSNYYSLLSVGRWLASDYPEITSPEQWTRELATQFVRLVEAMTIGRWSRSTTRPDILGKPLKSWSKISLLGAVRRFFLDCQDWDWIAVHLDPKRSLAAPQSIQSQVAPAPRPIDRTVWAKLIQAALNLTETDVPHNPIHLTTGYPLPMIQAVAITWLFCGLRANELRRLRIGCIRWQTNPAEGEQATSHCYLEVPAHKTGGPFLKVVDPLVGHMIFGWEQARPACPPMLDKKTGERVHFLFAYQNHSLGEAYLNDRLIPLLCHKAGVKAIDSNGPITSHRGRSTMASQLYDAEQPLSLLEIQAWLGHQSPETTRCYVQITATRQAQAYSNAQYFRRNIRLIDVLIDQDAIRSGATAKGEPWRYYDLGHGYCTYSFFDQCPHRMACAHCAFYRPKDTSVASLLEAKANLQRLMQEMPLKDEELAAVEDGLEALERLHKMLQDIPTPAGPTPRQISGFVPLDSIQDR